MNHYATLGLEKSASPQEIKTAYRKAVATHHPDKGGQDHTFHKIQEAYATLIDPEKRKAYDAEQSKKPVENLSLSVKNLVSQLFDRCKTHTHTH